MIEVFKIADLEYKTLKKPSSFYQLNFLFKIALLTHKCLHGCALICLKKLINLFASVLTRYSLRVNNVIGRGGVLKDVLGLGVGLEAYKSPKLSCPRFGYSIVF